MKSRYPALRLTTVGVLPYIAFVDFRQPILLSTWSAGINHTDRPMSSVAFAAFGSRRFAKLGLSIFIKDFLLSSLANVFILQCYTFL
jgi:hypothetical protein